MPKLSFWLVPAEPDFSFYQQVIQDLAGQFKGPQFAPHVTFYSGPVEDDENPESLARFLTRGLQPFSLGMGGLRYSPLFTKTFYVQLGAPYEIQELNRRLRLEVEQPTNYLLDPHLSLLYHEMEEEAQLTLVREYESMILDRGSIQFDAIWVVQTGNQVQTKGDVDSWKIITQRKFAGA